MLVKLNGSAVVGIDAIHIGIEINVSTGTNYYIVGLPDNTIKESLQRVESAIKQSGFKMPRTKIVINLFPADIRKSGAAFDLPIALGILIASEQLNLKRNIEDFVVMGELGLDGTIRSIMGVLPIALQAQKDKFKGILIPETNSQTASIIPELAIYGMNNLMQVVDFFEGKEQAKTQFTTISENPNVIDNQLDFADVQGQANVKRALEIAAAGAHNIIMIGPPGVGKTMLAKRIPTILPSMNLDELIQVTKIYSVSRGERGNNKLIENRPFRSPHHTISDIALVGGGSDPMPGEISLAHHGVLFLDELPEFKRTVLEVLRQPIEEKMIHISRAKMAVKFPANFMLVASMNPCPCGYYNHPEKECVCSSSAVHRYLQKISGPLLDRIDLHIEVTPINLQQLTHTEKAESSTNIRERIVQARQFQQQRYQQETNTNNNADLSVKQIKTHCKLDASSSNLLKTAVKQLELSARAHNGILKVARTIADLSLSPNIKAVHLAEAIQFRCLDRDKWGRK